MLGERAPLDKLWAEQNFYYEDFKSKIDTFKSIRKSIKEKMDNEIDTTVYINSNLHKMMNNFWDIPEVIEFGNFITPLIQADFFDSFCVVESIFIYEAIPMYILTEDDAEYIDMCQNFGFYKWHSDEEIEESSIRLLINLSDINIDQGPFEYIINKHTNKPIKSKGSAADTMVCRSLLGPLGTHIVYSPSIIHRTRIPLKYPEALFLAYTFKPSKTCEEYILKENVTSWQAYKESCLNRFF